MEFSIRLERITKIFLREKLSAWIKQSSLYRCNNILWRTRQESGANVLSLSTAKIARFLRILSNTIAWRSLINRVESRHASKDSTRKQREREGEKETSRFPSTWFFALFKFEGNPIPSSKGCTCFQDDVRTEISRVTGVYWRQPRDY